MPATRALRGLLTHAISLMGLITQSCNYEPYTIIAAFCLCGGCGSKAAFDSSPFSSWNAAANHLLC